MDWVAAITEWGAKQHVIKPKKDKLLKIGSTFVAGTVLHPGIRARHWMSGSMDASQSQFESAFYAGLEKWLNKYGR